MSSRAFNCPAFRKSRDIPRAHSCSKAWKLKAQPGRQGPGDTGRVCSTNDEHLFDHNDMHTSLHEEAQALTWIIPVVLQKHQPLAPRLYCLTTPVRFNVKFTIFMGGIGKKHQSKKKNALRHCSTNIINHGFRICFPDFKQRPSCSLGGKASFGTSYANMSASMKVRMP